ncbi:MAG: PAS-domain containing protein [Alphaproteobacteria bacterium]|nr:PAS-domain containing protein [Alphaproteobacteria bacterium]
MASSETRRLAIGAVLWPALRSALLIGIGVALAIAVERSAWEFIDPEEPAAAGEFLLAWIGVGAASVLAATLAFAALRGMRAERRDLAAQARQAQDAAALALAVLGRQERAAALAWDAPWSGAASPIDPAQPSSAQPRLLAPGRLIDPAAGEGVPRVLQVLRERLGDADHAMLEAACRLLRGEGTAFDLTMDLAAAPGAAGPSSRAVTRLRAIGSRVAGADVVQLVDDSDAARAEAAEAASRAAIAERDGHQALLDLLPLPIWQRDPALGVVAWNRAYAAASGGEGRRTDLAGRGLAQRARSGGSASESRHVVIDGARRLLALAEQALPGPEGRPGGTAGYALDLTALEEAQADLDRHIAAHGEVLHNLGTPIEIYGADRRIAFYNSAYLRMTGLDSGWLDDRPTLSEVLDALRERRRLPEAADFRAFKRQRERLFTETIDATQELLHLTDGSTWRMVVSPHPFGGLIMTYEDVTEPLELQRSYNTLIAVQRETLDHLHEGIAVFGSDGRLKLHNPRFAQIWALAPLMLQREPHVGDFAADTQHFFDRSGSWPDWRRWIIDRVNDPVAESGRIERADGSVVDYACVPLPDGGALFSFNDVTAAYRTEAALRDRIERLDRRARLAASAIDGLVQELSQGSGRRKPAEIASLVAAFASLARDPLGEPAVLASGGTAPRAASEVVPLRPLVDEIAALCAQRRRRADVALRIDCLPADVAARADRASLRLGLYYVLADAVAASPAGASIAVTCGACDDDARFVELSIACAAARSRAMPVAAMAGAGAGAGGGAAGGLRGGTLPLFGEAHEPDLRAETAAMPDLSSGFGPALIGTAAARSGGSVVATGASRLAIRLPRAA